LELKPSKAAWWLRRLTVARSHRMRARCCWARRIGRSGWWLGWHRALSISGPGPLSVATLVGQRIFAIALGYEDLNDHETLRHDPLMAVLAGKLEARRPDCAAVAGKSTLNRLELSKPEPSRYHEISYDAEAVDRLFVDLFLDAHRTAPSQITLDLDATDDPLHGEQEGRPRASQSTPIHAVKLALRPLPRASIITTCHFRKCRAEGERCWIWLRRVL
jgi:hypothetical protein